MMFNGLREIVNISLFYFLEKIEIRHVLKKVFLFLGWKNYSLGRCVHSVKTPVTLFICGIRSVHPFRIRSRRSFLLSYCTKINLYLYVKSKCTLFLQSNNQYLVQSHRKPTTYGYLLIRQPLNQLRYALFSCLICYLPYILLAQRWCIGSGDLYTLRGFCVAVVGF